jgi:hypothetical protein
MFGEEGVDAVLKEMKQLHNHGVLEPQSLSELSAEERQIALNYLMFLKRKQCGRVKGRGCADGRKQRQ